MNRKTILFADDTRFFVELEKTFFRREDFILITASSGDEALKVCISACPDLVFVDLYMPGISGDEFCRRIRSDDRTKQIPIVIVTMSGKEEDVERCRQSGCNDIIFKPINREHFIETARKYLQVQDRAQPRYFARLQIHFGKESGQLLSDYAINLSTGGVFLETTNLMEEDTPLMAEFKLPHRVAPIRCKARVAWVNHPDQIKNRSLPVGMGIQFLDLSEDSMNAIRSYIREEHLLPLW